MNIELVIVGGGGHALSIADALLSAGLSVRGYTDPRNQGQLAAGIPWLGDDSELASIDTDSLRLCNGIGSVGNDQHLRRSIYEQLKLKGFSFTQAVHASASVSPLAGEFGQGLQVLAKACVNAATECGENVLINTGAIVEHGCRIGSHCHIASGAILCGDVELGEEVHIGAGATVIQGVSIGSGAVIAAGAVVTENVEPLTLVAGVPGKVKRKIES